MTRPAVCAACDAPVGPAQLFCGPECRTRFHEELDGTYKLALRLWMEAPADIVGAIPLDEVDVLLEGAALARLERQFVDPILDDVTWAINRRRARLEKLRAVAEATGRVAWLYVDVAEEAAIAEWYWLEQFQMVD